MFSILKKFNERQYLYKNINFIILDNYLKYFFKGLKI